MRKMISSTLNTVLEVASFLVIAASIYVGWSMGHGDVGTQVLLAILGLFAGLIVASVIFGVVFVLIDIKESSHQTTQHTQKIAQEITRLDARFYEVSKLVGNMDQKVAQLANLQLHSSSERAISDAVADPTSPVAPH